MEVSGRRPLSNLLSKTLRFGSEEDTGLYCHACELNGQTVNVNGYCQNCRTYLCTSCIRNHGKATPTRNHIVNKIVDSSSTTVASDKLQNCLTHQNEEIKLYCRAHETFGCVICMTLSHKLCEIDFIPEVSEQFLKGDEYLSFQANVNNLKERCELGMNKIEANMVEIETAYAKVISAVEDTRKEIIKELDQFESDLKEEVTAYRKKNIETMDTLKKAYQSLVKNIVDTEAKTKSMIKDKKYNTLFYEVKQSFARFRSISPRLMDYLQSYANKNANFKRAPNSTHFLQKTVCSVRYILKT
ncbi:E3 ubiquitin-protein ligase TRIM33-like [Mercenaria mercenaria]|uniref:E3 ubiquitin-protein ligase TRIM33-like n=1 Tax=Mercenaria mercenaria TaxID=6596 RepID=UPI00234F3125|nr:E3 ubiquitin-protein ligase TRIM33-like [Mercenaria mercenaria]